MTSEPTRREGSTGDVKALGLALVGLGHYSAGQLGPALRHTKLCRLTAVVTGSPEKGRKWAAEYGFPERNVYSYDTFDHIADNDDIDIVYVVLPNNMHREFVTRAAQAGKHVITEKPMATTVADAEAMIEACRAAGRSLAVGYRMHYESNTQEIIRLARQRVYGPVQAISGCYAFEIGDPRQWRLDKEMAGGGPLMDIGIYVIQAAMYVHGGLPVAVTARSEVIDRERFRSVEENIYWNLEFPDGVIAQGKASYSAEENYLRVKAQFGNYALEPAYTFTGIQGRTPHGDIALPAVNQQALQMDAFADHIINGVENRVPGEMGLRDMKVLMAIYEAVETGRRVEIAL